MNGWSDGEREQHPPEEEASLDVVELVTTAATCRLLAVTALSVIVVCPAASEGMKSHISAELSLPFLGSASYSGLSYSCQRLC